MTHYDLLKKATEMDIEITADKRAIIYCSLDPDWKNNLDKNATDFDSNMYWYQEGSVEVDDGNPENTTYNVDFSCANVTISDSIKKQLESEFQENYDASQLVDLSEDQLWDVLKILTKKTSSKK